MKLNRLVIASVLGLAFVATSSAVACEHNNSSSNGHSEHHWSFLGTGWYNNWLNGTGGFSDDNQGKECDNGHGNDSSGCENKGGGSSSGGHTTSGGGSTGGSTGSGGGSTTAGGGKGIS